jgi:hypothetical protein
MRRCRGIKKIIPIGKKNGTVKVGAQGLAPLQIIDVLQRFFECAKAQLRTTDEN